MAPRSGRTVQEGAAVLLVGRGFDIADGKVDPSALRWTSDLQGDLGTGEKLVVRDLMPGEHTISLGLEGEPAADQSITVVVE